MRFLIAALILPFTFSVTAQAQEKMAAPKAIPSVAVPTPAKAVSDMKATEPNLKVLKGSGGKAESSLVTSAPLSSDFVMGKSSAPLIMIEYASLSCPHCAHFSNAVLPELEKKYIETGKLRYILRHFPLNEPALKGAMLVQCVGEQNSEKYYVFSKVLFDSQSKWAFDGNYMAGLETIASVGGVSKSQFQSCVNDTDREMKILEIKKEATDKLKIPHTPYIYIGDEIYEGERTIGEISQFIDAKLAEAQK